MGAGSVTSIEALNYAIDRLTREASIRPKDQHPEALQRKLAAIEALATLHDSLSRS
jgi:hypothetical protein